MSGVGDSFAWPFQQPGWFGKIVVQGLIAIIPIIGWIALAGWLLTTLDNYRAGRRELPPAGFYLERGVALFVVYLVYAIVFSIPGDILTSAGRSAQTPALSSLGSLINLALSLFLAFLAPAIILQTDRRGFGGGFDVNAVWQMASRNANLTLVAGVVIWVSGLLAGLGVVLCCVGLFFSIPYGAAVTAGAVTWYEGSLSGPATTSP